MRIGYARVSTSDQKLDLQIDALQAAGCDDIFEDKASGAGIQRTGLNAALAALQPGDTLVVWKLDRLGRSVKDLVTLLSDLQDRGVDFKSLQDSIDTNSSMGRFFVYVLAAFGEMERDLLKERTLAGVQAARSRGRFAGRPRKMTKDKISVAVKLRDEGTPIRDIAHALGVSDPTVYRILADARA